MSIRIALLALLAIVCLLGGIAGCKPPEADKPTPDVSAQTEAGGTSGEVAPIIPSAGGLAPMAGTESVTGAGGGGVGQAAKEKAKSMASQSPSSLGQDGGEGQ